MELDHVYETLKMAIDTLAGGTGTIQERLWQAWLIIHTLKIDEIPQEIREDFRKLWDALPSQQSAIDPDLRPTVSQNLVGYEQLDNHQAQHLALSMVQLFADTSAQFWPTHKKWQP